MMPTLALTLSAPFLLPSQSVSTPVITGPYHYPTIYQVKCERSLGTAFRVGVTRFISVAHVTSAKGCTINGQPIYATAEDGDFSTFSAAVYGGRPMKVDCGGFRPGRWYYAVGHARGWSWQTTLPLYATYAKAYNGMRMLLGSPTVIPGMSGGPLIDAETGAVAGTINAYRSDQPISYSRELRDTSICRRGPSAAHASGLSSIRA